MKITREADYALRMMCRLATETAGGIPVIGAATLAAGVAVPTRFGVKILHKLAEAGLVQSERGAGGGYRLIKAPETLTLRQIIEAIDGPIALNRCLAEDYDCENNPCKEVCRMHCVFGVLNALVVERLDRLTLAMLTDPKLATADLLEVVR